MDAVITYNNKKKGIDMTQRFEFFYLTFLKIEQLFRLTNCQIYRNKKIKWKKGFKKINRNIASDSIYISIDKEKAPIEDS